jgi:hypothetical protein
MELYANGMVNIEPINDLLLAQRVISQQDSPAAQKESLRLVSRAVGSAKPLPLLNDRLDKVFDTNHPLHNAVLRLALVETRKK